MGELFKFVAVLAITAVAILVGLAAGFLAGVVVWLGLVLLGYLVERAHAR